MSTLVLGGGAVGREVFRLLAARGEEVREAQGDLKSELRGMERLLLLTCQGAAAARAARAAGVRHVVHVSAIPSKTLESAGLSFTRIVPSHLYQKDLAVREAILGRGVYPLPIDPQGVNRVDAQDVAEASVRALLEPAHAGRTYRIVGPEPLTGEDVAAFYAHALGRPVRYVVDDRLRWEEPGVRATSVDFAMQDKILGRPPRPFGVFVGEAVRTWKEELVA